MKKMAFFVEGQTEQIFVNRLVRYLLGSKNTNIIQRKLKGGTNIPRQEITRYKSLARNPDFEVLIVDCGADNRVKSEMLENIENLHQNNYKYLVGLRDLYPLPLEELDKLNKGLMFLPSRLKHRETKFDIIVAVREIETWFLAESTHFERINKKLTCEFIQKKLSFNPALIDPVTREHPAEDMDAIYKLVGQSYAKKYNQTIRIVHTLDIKVITESLRYKIKEIDRLIGIIDEFKDMVDDDPRMNNE